MNFLYLSKRQQMRSYSLMGGISIFDRLRRVRVQEGARTINQYVKEHLMITMIKEVL